MKPSARAGGAEQTPVPKATTSANARLAAFDRRRGVALAATLFKWDTCRRAAHVSEEADKTNDGFEITEFEDASAGDEHFVVALISGNGADDPRAVPAVMALLRSLLADHLDEIALSEQGAQSVFGDHIRCFFYHELPWTLLIMSIGPRAHYHTVDTRQHN